MPVSALSAIGSATLPNEVTSVAAAGDPAVDEVGGDATQKVRHGGDPPAGVGHAGRRRRGPRTPAPARSATTVSTFAGVVQRHGTRGAVDRNRLVGHARRPRSSRSARRPGRRPRCRSPGPGPGRRGAARPGRDRRRRPAWSSRRPRAPGAPPGPRPRPSIDRVDQHLDHRADPLLGPLRAQLLGEGAHPVVPPLDRRPRETLPGRPAASVPSSSL